MNLEINQESFLMMATSTVSVLYTRRQVVDILSEDRNSVRPLHDTRITQWMADLDWQRGIRLFDETQLMILRKINLFYHRGGRRADLIKLMEGNPKWYQSLP